MTPGPAEETVLHTRLLKCALAVEESRAYWRQAVPGGGASAEDAFTAWWFGAKSLDRVQVLFTNLRARFDAFPTAHRVLHGWTEMPPGTRALICHWHLQLSDPLYRSFTGELIPERRASARPTLTRDLVVEWVGQHAPGRWTMPTRIQFASKLLSSAFSAGLVGSNRDPRPLPWPRVEDTALAYMVHLLREVAFEGTLLSNPYFRSVGLEGGAFEERLRGPVGLRRQGGLLEFDWPHPSLTAWAEARGIEVAA
jgi:hypothetical protein